LPLTFIDRAVDEYPTDQPTGVARLTAAFRSIVLELSEGVATLTLNRPDRLNAFNDAMHAEVRDALARIGGDRTIRAMILTGAGRGFCAGQDLAERSVAPGDAPRDLGASLEANYNPREGVAAFLEKRAPRFAGE
jgi:2-(1,2-epoxy-1,2-dihydrophenyl)acetyl-CoA isomerase